MTMRGKIPILEEMSSWEGRHAASFKAMPKAMPVRRGCGKEKVLEKRTKMEPPRSGPRPNKRETTNPDASSEL